MNLDTLDNMHLTNLKCCVFLQSQSLTITMVSYMGKLRVAVGTEKGHIDPNKFKSCVQNSFDMMFKAVANSPSHPN